MVHGCEQSCHYVHICHYFAGLIFEDWQLLKVNSDPSKFPTIICYTISFTNLSGICGEVNSDAAIGAVLKHSLEIIHPLPVATQTLLNGFSALQRTQATQPEKPHIEMLILQPKRGHLLAGWTEPFILHLLNLAFACTICFSSQVIIQD